MLVLGIESTAHTIGVGIASDKPPFVLSNVYRRYVPSSGGIHPRESSRFIAENAYDVLVEALARANLSIKDIDAIAVALGPGLGPCLRIGATLARFLALRYGKPLVPVNHAVAHIEIGMLTSGFRDPLVIYVSGGNTAIIAFLEGKYRVFGETIDISLGNLIDTFAREAGLAPPYIVNGRHVVELCASRGDRLLSLPYSVKGQDVSYSGLLTAALNMVRNGERLEDVCLSLIETAYSMIIEVAERGLAHTRKKEVLLTGGVSASPLLESKAKLMAESHEALFHNVPREYAGDNGAMIAWTGLLAYKHGVTINPLDARIEQKWRVDEVDIPWRNQAGRSS